jgi:hypothetical protein
LYLFFFVLSSGVVATLPAAGLGLLGLTRTGYGVLGISEVNYAVCGRVLPASTSPTDIDPNAVAVYGQYDYSYRFSVH